MKLKKKIFIKRDKKIKETELLSLNIRKSKKYLKWKPKLSFKQTLNLTAKWYECYLKDKKTIEKFSRKQVEDFFYD